MAETLTSDLRLGREGRLPATNPVAAQSPLRVGARPGQDRRGHGDGMRGVVAVQAGAQGSAGAAGAGSADHAVVALRS